MEHRLTEWRHPWAAPLPGQALVVVDQPRLCITEVLLTEDGPAQERRLLQTGLPSVGEGERWSEDRTCWPLGLLFGMARRGASVLVRQQGPLQGERRGRPKRQGVTRSGTGDEQEMRIRDPAGGEGMRVRRIPLARKEPTRDGDTARPRLSKVPSADARAGTRAVWYGKRGRLETAFLEMTTTLSCAINPLGDPQAALLALCLALLASNAVSVIKAALRRAHGRQKGHAEGSGSDRSLEVRRTSDGMMRAIPAPPWAVLGEMSDVDFAHVRRELASSVNLSKDRKHPRGPKQKPPQRAAYQNGSHVSTAKLIAQR